MTTASAIRLYLSRHLRGIRAQRYSSRFSIAVLRRMRVHARTPTVAASAHFSTLFLRRRRA